MSVRLQTGNAGSRLAIIITTAIITAVLLTGGIAVAASVGVNSVGSAQIKDHAIRSIDIRNGQVSSADLKNNDIRSADIRNGSVSAADLAAGAQPAGVAYADGDQAFSLDSSALTVREVTLVAPAAGQAIVTASGFFDLSSEAFDRVSCTITDGAVAVDSAHTFAADDEGIDIATQFIPFSSTRTFEIGNAGPVTFRLVCLEDTGVVVIGDSAVTALYVPANYTAP